MCGGKTKSLLVLALLLSLFSARSLAQDDKAEDTGVRLRSIASDFFARVSAGRFSDAAELFHFPPSFTSAERAKDAKGVALTLRILAREFGRPENPKPDDSFAVFYSVGGGGGDPSYWQQYPLSLDLRYRVHFDREGDGFVIFKFSTISGAIEIKQLNYGIPANRAGALERTNQIIQTLIKEKGYPEGPAPEQKPLGI